MPRCDCPEIPDPTPEQAEALAKLYVVMPGDALLKQMIDAGNQAAAEWLYDVIEGQQRAAPAKVGAVEFPRPLALKPKTQE